MKDRIEELANRAYESGDIDTGPLYGSIHSAITTAVNEALELAARELEKRCGERHGYDKHDDAAAIRKLKVAE